jgi:putative nucleotidyltransferase with HDIG domain
MDRARELLASIRQLPVLPDGAARLLKFQSSSEVTIEELLAIIEHDPVLTAMVLRVVNSAAFGLGRPVTNISQAIVLLGTSHVRSLAIAASLSTTMSNEEDQEHQELWRHAFAVACASRVVAQRVYPLEAGTAFAAGLLHDLGVLIMYSQYADRAREVQEITAEIGLANAEQNVFGTTHVEIGSALVEHWRLPEVLRSIIVGHHGRNFVKDEAVAMPDGINALLCSIVRAAEQLWLQYDGPIMFDAQEDPTPLCAAIGVAAPEALAAEIVRDVNRHLAGAGLRNAHQEATA